MMAFKAANPGCSLPDFVRWHSPRDWIVDSTHAQGGHLSARMNEDSIWKDLWASCKPIPALQQRPLFDAAQELEKALHYLEYMDTEELLES